MLTVKFDPHLHVEKMMPRSIHPNLVEIAWMYAWSHFGRVRMLWLYSRMNIFPVDAVSLHSEKKPFE